jgi:hypothetical protein
MDDDTRRRGRPKGQEPRKIPITAMLSPDTADWAMQQPGGASATVRKCLEQMQRAAEQQRE